MNNIVLHNAGYTMTDGFSDVDGVIYERDRENVKGYCFYHWQNLEGAVKGDGLIPIFLDRATHRQVCRCAGGQNMCSVFTGKQYNAGVRRFG
ncbi:hypothetical protein [Microseira sp. BLCC-F43]|jgi:hypothetical protein|uniref:DUF6891 domain-containing protein n=1 Tax=Microseira sp. BLCC-F43 TaxID=3153602 RepID=UPI0035B9B742